MAIILGFAEIHVQLLDALGEDKVMFGKHALLHMHLHLTGECHVAWTPLSEVIAI